MLKIFVLFLALVSSHARWADDFWEPVLHEQLGDRFENILLDLLDTDVVRGMGIDDHVAELETELLREDDNGTAEDTRACRLCRRVFAFGQALTTNFTWDELEDPLTDLCIVVGRNISRDYIDAETLCPGMVTGQGPHIYEVLRPEYNKEPRLYCEYLHFCTPPKPSTRQTRKYRQPDGTANSNKPDRKRDAGDLRATIKFVHITDVHIQPKYAEGTESSECGLPTCCIPANGPGDAGEWGSYECNTALWTMEYYLDWVAQQNADFVVYSGDTPPHESWAETFFSQLNCTDILVKALATHVPGVTIYPCIGNHEMYPTNLYSTTHLPQYTGEYNNAFAEGWAPLANFSEAQKETMRAGGYYSMIITPGLRIISFNTQYWINYNWYNFILEGSEELEAHEMFLRQELQAAQENNEKVLLVGHGPAGGGDSIVQRTRGFEDILFDYGDVVTLHMAGHTHVDEFRVLTDSDGNAVSVHLVTPSFTPKTFRNPSARIYYLDEETFEVVDYEQYHFDLLETFFSGKAEPDIKLVYSAKDEYGLADLTASSWLDLSNRMASDDELFQIYNQNLNTRFYDVGNCTDQCKQDVLCQTKFYSYDEVRNCRDDEYHL